jgi:hypothetical protein
MWAAVLKVEVEGKIAASTNPLQKFATSNEVETPVYRIVAVRCTAQYNWPPVHFWALVASMLLPVSCFQSHRNANPSEGVHQNFHKSKHLAPHKYNSGAVDFAIDIVPSVVSLWWSIFLLLSVSSGPSILAIWWIRFLCVCSVKEGEHLKNLVASWYKAYGRNLLRQATLVDSTNTVDLQLTFVTLACLQILFTKCVGVTPSASHQAKVKTFFYKK